MSNRIPYLKLVCLILLFSVSIFSIYVLLPDFFDKLKKIISDLKTLPLVLAFAATVFHFLAEPIRWFCYLKKIKPEKPAGPCTLINVFSATALATYIFPAKLGLPFRLYLLANKTGLSMIDVSSTMAFDGIVAYSVWGIATVCLLPFYRVAIPPPVTLFIILIFLVVLFFFLTASSGIEKIKIKIKIPELYNINTASLSSGIIAIDIAGYIARHALILSAAGIELTFIQISFVTIVSIFAGFISMLPMGLGAYDVTIILLLSQLGVPHSTSIMVPLVNRTLNILTSFVLGMPASYFLGISFLSVKNKLKANSDNDA